MKHLIFKKDLCENLSTKSIVFGAGCFWGVEKKFWQLSGVTMTSVGYSGGNCENPSYEEVCSGLTNHVEVVKVTYKNNSDIKKLLKTFWECHDPTQGMRQGNDIGTQYRSVIFCNSENQLELAKESQAIYQKTLKEAGYNSITTEISMLQNYYLAEEYHQQYLAKNPSGYCGIGGTNCTFPSD